MIDFHKFWVNVEIFCMFKEAEDRGLRVREFVEGERENCYAMPQKFN